MYYQFCNHCYKAHEHDACPVCGSRETVHFRKRDVAKATRNVDNWLKQRIKENERRKR